MKKVFTTGQVAKICKVAPCTVSKWFDAGRLRGYCIPGSQTRRIPREYLVAFMKEHGLPLGDLEDGFKILVVGADKALLNRLDELLPATEKFEIEIAANSFEAGMMAEGSQSLVIIIDLAMGRSEAVTIAKHLRRNPMFEQALILALAIEDDAEPDALRTCGFDEVFKKPFDAVLLTQRVRRQKEAWEAE
ncbi:MAG: excisionase family DNA-binding [Candidatus Peregrinibacteria bacterium Greene0416_19]|nr:MAG: excisionase family DNA-binding [Candidatus Peregrinibacteria bacterium Greene0416_19]